MALKKIMILNKNASKTWAKKNVGVLWLDEVLYKRKLLTILPFILPNSPSKMKFILLFFAISNHNYSGNIERIK